MGRMLALQVAELDLIPGITYCPQAHYAELGVKQTKKIIALLNKEIANVI